MLFLVQGYVWVLTQIFRSSITTLIILSPALPNTKPKAIENKQSIICNEEDVDAQNHFVGECVGLKDLH